MTPEEIKAKELFDKFKAFTWATSPRAKKCAIKCVEELIKEHTYTSPISWNVKQKKYWESVKLALEAM